jgi:hypothetical protein
MGQNQWNYTANPPAWEEKGLDGSAETRMKGHIRVFKELCPDIVGGQEVNKDMQLFFMIYCQEEKLPYTLIGGNMTPIIYRADKFELLATEYLLYPKHMEGYEGSFNDADSKACNLGVFRDKESGKVFIFVTTHLWWRNGSNPAYYSYQAGSDEAREYQLRLLVGLVDKYRAQYGECPVVSAGDMNTGITSPALSFLKNEAGYTHAHDAAAEYATEISGYCACGPKAPAEKWFDTSYAVTDDHIYVKDMPEGAVKRFDRYCPDYYLLLSDHAPVYIDIEF